MQPFQYESFHSMLQSLSRYELGGLLCLDTGLFPCLWDLPQKVPTEDKIESFKKDGRLFDLIISQQLNKKIIDDIYEITNHLRKISKTKDGSLFVQNILCHKRAMLYIAQPSFRTFLSFESSCHRLGIKTSEIRDVNVSSEVKGDGFVKSRHSGENRSPETL